ncbi:unnamed protein product, partial [Meganyctiphanes norvegica]
GEIIAVETAYSSFLKPKEPNSPFSFCTFCLARCAAPIPCHECTKVVFCNEECRSKGWDKFHMKECPVYSNLLEFDEWVMSTYRIIAKQSIDELKVFVSQCQKEEHRSPLEQLLNEDQVCDSDSYRGVYFLEGNIKAVEMETLLGYSYLAFMLTHLLAKSNRYFVTNKGDKYVPDEEDMFFIGSLFIRHILAVTCNGYAIQETHVQPYQVCGIGEHVSLVKVGGGTYIALSMFNHSCSPSAMLLSYGSVLICRASCFIPSGSQVRTCYYYPYFSQPDRANRREALSNFFSFFCKCDACVNDYRVSADFISSRLRTEDKIISRNNWEITASLVKELNSLMEGNSQIALRLTTISDVTNYLNLAMETIEFYDRYV